MYCALELAECVRQQSPLFVAGRAVAASAPVTIGLFEGSSSFGGRIETSTIDLQPYQDFVQQVSAPRAKSSPGEGREYYYAECGPMRIEPRHQPLLRQLLDHLGFCEASGDQEQLTDLIKFAEYAAEEPREPKYPLTCEEAEQHSLLDLLLLAIRRVFELTCDDGHVEWPSNPIANEYWKQFLSSSSVRRRYWKGELHDFIVSLTETDYEFI